MLYIFHLIFESQFFDAPSIIVYVNFTIGNKIIIFRKLYIIVVHAWNYPAQSVDDIVAILRSKIKCTGSKTRFIPKLTVRAVNGSIHLLRCYSKQNEKKKPFTFNLYFTDPAGGSVFMLHLVYLGHINRYVRLLK